MLGIPDDVVDATEHLLRIADDWRPRAIDLPRVNDRHFTFAAGLGLDASVVERVDSRPHLKARLGEWYFTWAGVSTFVRRYLVNPPRLLASVEGRELPGVTAIVQNGAPYTYFGRRPVHVAEGAALDDGTLSGVVLRRAHPVDMPTIIWRALARRPRMVRHRQIDHFENVTELAVRSLDGRPIPLEVDGDHLGEVTEARFAITPGGLTVVS
jgi:diacylglycerol kinase family enzyme